MTISITMYVFICTLIILILSILIVALYNLKIVRDTLGIIQGIIGILIITLVMIIGTFGTDFQYIGGTKISDIVNVEHNSNKYEIATDNGEKYSCKSATYYDECLLLQNTTIVRKSYLGFYITRKDDILFVLPDTDYNLDSIPVSEKQSIIGKKEIIYE